MENKVGVHLYLKSKLFYYETFIFKYSFGNDY